MAERKKKSDTPTRARGSRTAKGVAVKPKCAPATEKAKARKTAAGRKKASGGRRAVKARAVEPPKASAARKPAVRAVASKKKAARSTKKPTPKGQAGAGADTGRRTTRLQARVRACRSDRKAKIWEDADLIEKAKEFIEYVQIGFRIKETEVVTGLSWDAFNRIRQHRAEIKEWYAEALREKLEGPLAGRVLETHEERGLDGWDEPVFQGGKLVGKQRRYSERSMEFLSRATMPEVYRERVDGNIKGNFQLISNVPEPDPVPPELRRKDDAA